MDPNKLNPYTKAIVGALGAGVGALMTALADDGVTAIEWCVVALAVLGTLTGVWATSNTPAGGPVVESATVTVETSTTEPATATTYEAGRAPVDADRWS